MLRSQAQASHGIAFWRLVESHDGDIKKLMASPVPESSKKSPKYASNVFQGGESHEETFNIYSYVNLNRFILQDEDLIQCDN